MEPQEIIAEALREAADQCQKRCTADSDTCTESDDTENIHWAGTIRDSVWIDASTTAIAAMAVEALEKCDKAIVNRSDLRQMEHVIERSIEALHAFAVRGVLTPESVDLNPPAPKEILNAWESSLLSEFKSEDPE